MTSADSENSEDPTSNKRKKELPVNNDGRDLFMPDSMWTANNRKSQTIEAFYIVALLLISLSVLAYFGYLRISATESGHISFFGASVPPIFAKYGLLAAGGLLGGTVYGAKWLYHAVAKGLWHEDRRLWRFMQPWISLGTTIGIFALIDSGFFKSAPRDISMLGIGFVVGYLSDQFLAKMKEITNVLFGRAERHADRLPKGGNGKP